MENATKKQTKTVTPEYIAKWRAWAAKRKNWPLTLNTNGTWVKVIKGRRYSFGRLHQWKEALEKFEYESPFLKAGQVPPYDHLLLPTGSESCTLNEAFDKCIENIEHLVKAGERSKYTLDDYKYGKVRIAEIAGAARPIDLLSPDDWRNLRGEISTSGLSLRSQKNIILTVRSVVKWAGEMEYCTKTPRYGRSFSPPALVQIETQQEEESAVRFIDREFILKAIEKATPKMKVAILLGINLGFYGSDSASIPLDRLYLDGPIPFHDFRRVKTKQKRKGVLWPETVEAVRDYVENHRQPKDRAERQLLLNRNREAYKGRSINTGLVREFKQLLETVGYAEDGVSIGSLRHTYGTAVDLAGDQKMIDLSMGHTSKALQKRIYSQLNLGELDRLQRVANVVHDWLYEGEIG